MALSCAAAAGDEKADAHERGPHWSELTVEDVWVGCKHERLKGAQSLWCAEAGEWACFEGKVACYSFYYNRRKMGCCEKGEPRSRRCSLHREKKTGNEKLCTHSCAQLTYPHPALTKYILNLLTQPQVNKVVVRGTKWSFADAPTRLLLPLVDRQKAAGDTWGHILRKDGAVGAAQLSVSWVYKKTGVWKLCWVNPRGLENTTELWPRSLPSVGRPPPTHPSACFFETVHLWKPLRTDLAVSGFTVT